MVLSLEGEKIFESFEHFVKNIVQVKTMENAISNANLYAEKGDVVLLSPACASFDLFKNYEERGKQFKK